MSKVSAISVSHGCAGGTVASAKTADGWSIHHQISFTALLGREYKWQLPNSPRAFLFFRESPPEIPGKILVGFLARCSHHLSLRRRARDKPDGSVVDYGCTFSESRRTAFEQASTVSLIALGVIARLASRENYRVH